MTKLAIIGGTGLTQLSDLTIIKRDQLTTLMDRLQLTSLPVSLTKKKSYFWPDMVIPTLLLTQNKLSRQYLGA